MSTSHQTTVVRTSLSTHLFLQSAAAVAGLGATKEMCAQIGAGHLFVHRLATIDT